MSLPAAGHLTINASATRKVAVKASAARVRTIRRNATVASVASNLSAGVHTLTLRPKGLARLARKLVVRLRTTYTPAGGAPRTIQRSATLKRTVSSKHKHRG